MAVSATDEAKISTASKSARLRDIFWVFVKIGLLSFGGPAGQIALMHRILVDEKEWLDEQSFLNALNFCMLLPGPEAMQLATFAGWRLRGISGGLIAGGLFVLPGAVVMLILSISYVAFSGTSMLSGIFLGVKAAILVVVVQALITLSRRALTQTQHYVISGAAFVGLFFLNLSYPVIVIASGSVWRVFPKRISQRPANSIARRCSDSPVVCVLFRAICHNAWGGALPLAMPAGHRVLGHWRSISG